MKAANVKKPKETRKAGPRSSPSVNEPPGKCGGTRTSPSASSPEVLPSPMLSWKENNSTSQKPSNLPSLSTEELEERDVRAAVRDMLHQHHLQKALRRRNAKMLAQEQKSSEQAALEWLEKELQRQGNRAHSAGLVREDGEGEEAEKSSPTEIIEALANALENKRGAVEETEKNAWSLTEMQRLHHHLRMKQRQEEKERNAARLCELSGSVEGVLPVSVSSPRGEQEDFGSRRTTPVNGKGVALSPKEVAAMEEAAEDALRMRNVMSLGNVKPDLSVYSIENDIRISSEQVVSVQRLEKERLERSRTSPSSASTSSLQEGVLSTTRTNPSLVGGVAGSPQVLSYAAQSASTCHGAEDFDLDEEKAIAATVKAYDEDDDL